MVPKNPSVKRTIMSHDKDIFDLFRDNQHKLHQSPSPRTWRRLERRLDTRRDNHRTYHVFQSFGMVAAILLIAVFTFLMTVGFGEQRNRLFAFNNKKANSPQLEQLTYSDVSYPSASVSADLVMVAQHAQEQRKRVISEGTAWQKLVPKGQNTVKKESYLHQFSWLRGKWQSVSTDGQLAILEEWSPQGDQLMVGTARKDGKVIERMRLDDSRDRLSFISDFGTGKEVRYTLKTLNQREAIFENLQAGFPEQIVLLKASPSRLTVIYRNAALEANGNTDRLRALQQRHQLSSQQAVRYLSRLALQ
jgi:hypothetical protein